MEEDDEGNDSLRPDQTEGHRRGYTGALGWPGGWREREKKDGAWGEEEGVRVPSPWPDPLSRSNPPHRKYRRLSRYFRPHGISDGETAEISVRPEVPVTRPVVPLQTEKLDICFRGNLEV